MFPITLLLLLSAFCVLATPSRHDPRPRPNYNIRCNTASAIVNVPANQSTFPTSSGPVSFIGLGVGTQNYTCTTAGNYSNVGAYAELFDISCLYGTILFDNVQDIVLPLWANATPKVTALNLARSIPPLVSHAILGEHYFVPNPTGSGLSPKWDFTSRALKGRSSAFVIGAKNATLNAPTGSQDIPWLFLTSVEGKLASKVYRTDTRHGQAPAECSPGSPDIQVKYVSKYWFLGGSFSM